MKKFFYASFIFLFSLSAFAISKKDFSVEIEPLFGLKSGQADEYVFLKNSNYDEDKLSELNWDYAHEFYGGLKVNAGFKNIFLETSFSAGIPSRVGQMKDSDWQNLNFSGTEIYQFKTNYSESDNSLEYDFSYKVKAGYAFNLPEFKNIKSSIKPFAGFQYKNFKFNGKNGTAWYGNYVEDHYAKYNDILNQTIYDFSGEKVISYKRSCSIFWIGLDAELNLLENLIFSTGFKTSPYLYCESIDNHHLTGYDYLDITPGFFAAFEWQIGAEYKITKKQSICLNTEYFYMRALRGDNYSKADSQGSFRKSNKSQMVDGGADERYFAISVSYKFKIL